jgi:hypothetical protein
MEESTAHQLAPEQHENDAGLRTLAQPTFVLATINSALEAARQEPLDVTPLENRLARVSRAMAARPLALARQRRRPR